MGARTPPTLPLSESGTIVSDGASNFTLNPLACIYIDTDAGSEGAAATLLDPLDQLPDASECLRGVVAINLCDPGADDSLRVCLRDASGDYRWYPVMTGEP